MFSNDDLSLETLKEVYNNLPCGVVLYTAEPDPHILYMNRHFVNILEDSEKSAGKTTCTDLMHIFPEYERESVRENIALAITTDAPVPFERQFLTANGQLHTATGSIQLFHYERDRKLILSTFTDVTDRKKEQEKQKQDQDRYRIIVEQVGFTVLDWDLVHGRFYASDNYQNYAMSTFKPDIIVRNEGGTGGIHPEDADIMTEFAQRSSRDEHTEVTLRLKMTDGSYRWTQMSATRLTDETGKPVRTIGTLMDVDDLTRARQNLLEARQTLADTINALPAGIEIYRINPDPQVVFLSDRCCEILDITREDFEARPDYEKGTITGLDIHDFPSNLEKEFMEGRQIEMRSRIRHKDGKEVWIRIVGKKVEQKQTGDTLAYLTILDVTAQVERERKSKWKEECYRLLSENSDVVTYDYNTVDDRFTYAQNRNGVSSETTVEHFFRYPDGQDRTFPPELLMFRKAFFRSAHQEGAYTFEYEGRLFGKLPRWYRSMSIRIEDERGEVYRIVGRIDDIHSSKLAELRLREQANNDPLTGLLNRTGFTALTKKAFENRLTTEMKTGLHQYGSFVLIDIDHFKEINDEYGHYFGDKILCRVADALDAAAGKNGITSRFGGDEFTMFIPDAESPEELKQRIRDLTGLLQSRINDSMDVTVSIGAARFPEDGADFNSLYEAVDRSLYRAKAQGGNQAAFYSETFAYLPALRPDLIPAVIKQRVFRQNDQNRL
ncbi:MAG: diguanylate cyclase domain-containing protein [Eubacteriaceae bacterium]|jgi:diguanylate cyclase (GGDEF)-like protein/PAS domain S-box-containing protein